MDFRHESALRCVHFPPRGDVLIVGGVNPPSSNEGLPNSRAGDPRRRGGMSGGGMSFHLRMWDFSLDAVLNPGSMDDPMVTSGEVGNNGNGGMLGPQGPQQDRPQQQQQQRGGRISDDGELIWNYRVMKEALDNARTIIPRVLLYNDGGFDLSENGKILSACADFWLPEGINNVMELVESQRQREEEEQDQKQQQRRQSSSSSGESNETSGSGVCLTSSPVGGMHASNSIISSPAPRGGLPFFPDPRTPPPSNFGPTSLEPPSPPGKRNVPHMPRGQARHTPHPLSVIDADHPAHQHEGGRGRYVPHIVTVSLDTSPPPDGQPLPLHPRIVRTESMRRHPNLGKLLVAAPLDGAKSSGVTCVKLSPTAEYCLLGYGVRENIPSVHDHEEERHPVTSLYNVARGMKHVCTLTCADDDVNIARFHPSSGHGFVYGTKQGRVRVMAKRPWNYYHLEEGRS